MKLDKVAIGIKTFLRDQALKNALDGILDTMPEVKIIVADDGETSLQKETMYAHLTTAGHTVIRLPFDSGFGMKSNKIADALDRPYLLVGADDFDFKPSYVREGIEKMVEILDSTDVDIAGGRVRGHGPYEYMLEDTGDVVIEHRLPVDREPKEWYICCDLTVNYKLVKKAVFEKVRWLDSCKIGGGEHAFFFLQAKRAGLKTAFVPGAEIKEIPGCGDARYALYRSRAGDSARPCFDAIGVRKYQLGNGKVDYDANTISR